MYRPEPFLAEMQHFSGQLPRRPPDCQGLPLRSGWRVWLSCTGRAFRSSSLSILLAIHPQLVDINAHRQSGSAPSVAALTQVAPWRINIMQRGKKGHETIRCRDCPFWAHPTRCLHPALKSGHCGDWIWSVRAGKQLRRLYACPEDPRTVPQLLCGRRFAAASRDCINANSFHSPSLSPQADIVSPCPDRQRSGQSGNLLSWLPNHASRGVYGTFGYWTIHTSCDM